jgi:hypothetical protein
MPRRIALGRICRSVGHGARGAHSDNALRSVSRLYLDEGATAYTAP